MPFSSSAFGLSLRSNHRLPGLHGIADQRTADIRIWMSACPVGLDRGKVGLLCYPVNSPDEHVDGLQVWSHNDGRLYRLRYGDGTEFFLDRFATEIFATWPESSTLEDTSIYLLGPVLGFALRLRGITCLHASAVQVGRGAIALLGPGQAGKSTTAAAFAEMGYRSLTDDVAALVERDRVPYVQPGYPQLRLWPDSVAVLYGSQDALPQLTPTWAKCALDLTRYGAFPREPLPLIAIYVLGDRTEGASRIEPLTGREQLRTLLAHSYVGYLLDRAQREREFEFLTRVGSQVPVKRVTSAGGPSSVFSLCSRILEDCEAIGCTASPIMAR